MTLSVESFVSTISRSAREMDLPGISEEAAYLVTNKVAMKKKLKETGLPCGNFIWAKSTEEALDKIESIRFPFVIKPADRAGSRGVLRLNDIKELKKYFNTALSESRCGEVIIEEFLDGVESTVDSITYNGSTYVLGVSDKEKIQTPNIIAMDLTFPPSYPKTVQKKVQDLAKRALKALSVEFGPSHIEVIVKDGEPVVVEVAGRAGGGLIPSDVLPYLCGFDVLERFIRLSLGEDPGIPDYSLKNSVVLRFFKAPTGGILEKITGVYEVKNMKNVVKLGFIVKKGDLLRPLKEDNDRAGFVIVKGKDRHEATELADRVEKTIKFNVK